MLTENFEELALGDNVYSLHYDVRTAIKISESFGGIKVALTKIQDYDVNSFALLLRSCGIGLSTDKLKELVVDTGMIEIANILIPFLINILNGGKKSIDDEVQEDSGKSQK